MNTLRSWRRERKRVLDKATSVLDKIEEENREATPIEKDFLNLTTVFVENGDRLRSVPENAVRQWARANSSGIETGEFSRSDHEAFGRFDICKFVREAGENRLSGVEAEMSQEAVNEARRGGFDLKGYGVPGSLLRSASYERRDLTAGVDSEGGHTIQTDLVGFVDALRRRRVLRRMGATWMTDLQGNVAVPRLATKSSPGSKGETAEAGESSPTFDQVTLSPHRVTTYLDVSRLLVIQSSLDAQRVLSNDLNVQTAVKMQDLIINGSGSNDEPTGILKTTGIGSVVGGTNGAAPTRQHLVNLKKELAVDDADMGALGFVTNAHVQAKLENTLLDTGSGRFVWEKEGMLLNLPAGVTNSVPSNGTKGTGTALSAIICANWTDLLIGMWGGLDLIVNPYTKARQGLIEIVINAYFDSAVRHAESFAAMTDAITT